MRAPLIPLLMLLLGLAVPSARALQMPIYEGEAPLAAEAAADDEATLRAAFVQVLVKVSGDRGVGQDDGLSSVLADARRGALTLNVRTAADGRRVLVANFDPGAVHDALAALGRPVWAENRPPLLVWLDIDDGRQKQIASAGQVAALGAMTERARARGVPMLLPRMDAVDQNRINPVTLWGAPPQTIIGAGQRYGVTAMLVIRLTLGNPWQARCTLIDGRSYEDWELSDTQSNTVLAAAIDGAADRLARRYAVEPEGSAIGGADWWIDGIDNAADYAAVIGYLGKLDVVRDLRVLRAEGSHLRVHLDLAVGERRLRQLFAIDGRVRLDPGTDADPALRLTLLP